MPKTSKWRLKKKLGLAHSFNNGEDGGPSKSDLDTSADSDSAMSGSSTGDPGCLNDERNYVGSDRDSCNEMSGDEQGAFDAWNPTLGDDDHHWYDSNEEDNDQWFDCNEEDVSEDCSSSDSYENAQPIYKGSKLTVAESMGLIFMFSIRHYLTGECISDLLTLISLHCLTPHLITKSLYLFKKYFAEVKTPLNFHKFCSNCSNYISEPNLQKCPICKQDAGDNTSFFIECSLIQQIRNLFSQHDFLQKLQHRFNRNKMANGNLEDIYDGSVYRKHFGEDGILSNKNNLSFTLYTDGVPLFKSSKFSIWPTYFVINELPYKIRMQKENMLLGGIWFGGNKPSFDTYLKPTYDELTKLENGIKVELADGQDVIVKGILLSTTCDLPARSMIMNMVQFNGHFGCAHCLQEGNSVPTGKGHTWVYLYNNLDGHEKRNHENFCLDGKNAAKQHLPTRGVKGLSWLMFMPHFDIINGMAVDYMHCVLLGIVRKLLSLWFNSSFSREDFSLGKNVKKVEDRLKEIKPPTFVTRTPRSIKEHSKFWKASECRAWLLFYSIPVLYGIMIPAYFEHHCLLVEAIYILNKVSISHYEVDHCEKLLKQYCFMFQVLYGEKHMSANMHQLLHLTSCVKNLGPLWVYSCFKFEDHNGQLLKMFHGAKNPELQICTKFQMLVSLPRLTSKFNSTQNTEVNSFLEKMLHTYHVQKGLKICDNVFSLGKLNVFAPPLPLLRDISKELGYTPSKCLKFLRMLLHGSSVHSKEYGSLLKRNSFTVLFLLGLEELVGQIEYFVRCCSCDSGKDCIDFCEGHYLAKISCLSRQQSPTLHKEVSDVNLQHIVVVSSTVGRDIFVPVCQITSLCVYIHFKDIDSVAYISRAPNLMEYD